MVRKIIKSDNIKGMNIFFGCKAFSKTNHYLKQNGIEPIDWQLDA